MHGNEATHQNIVSVLSRATCLRKTDSPSPRSHQLSVVPRICVGDTSVPLLSMLACFALVWVSCRQPQLLWVQSSTVLSFPEDISHSSTPRQLALTVFPPGLLWCSLREGCDIGVPLVAERLLYSYWFSTLPPVWAFVNIGPPHKDAPLMRTEIDYGCRGTYLEDSLIPSPFRKIVIAGLTLMPMNFPAVNSRSNF